MVITYRNYIICLFKTLKLISSFNVYTRNFIMSVIRMFLLDSC